MIPITKFISGTILIGMIMIIVIIGIITAAVCTVMMINAI
jgi:hypothetical protein